MADILTVENFIAFLTLTSLEIVLGIDNIVFIAILAGRIDPEHRDRARSVGLLFALLSRIALVCCIGWIMKLQATLFSLMGNDITGKDLILIAGGLFLLFKATHEIHQKIEGSRENRPDEGPKLASWKAFIIQVMLVDVVFSLDSVITAVGMTQNIPIMIAAIVASVGVMLIFSGPIVRFIDKHPAIKLLALSFLLLIGMLLVAEGFHQHIGKGYIYFAMAFALGVEVLQILSQPKPPDEPPAI